MKVKKFWIAASVFVVCIAVCICIAQTTRSHRSTRYYQQKILRKLDAVQVVVNVFETVPEKSHLGAKLQTQVEDSLRISGLKVTPDDLNEPCIYIHVRDLKVKDIRVFYIETVLLEKARIMRNQETLALQSWSCRGVIDWIPHDKDYVQYVSKVVYEQVSEFVNDYLAANPKETQVKSKNNN